jgi:hypothetical protein
MTRPHAAALIAQRDRIAQRITARQIIEARLGRALPPTRELPADLRTAIKGLAVQLIRNKETAR